MEHEERYVYLLVVKLPGIRFTSALPFSTLERLKSHGCELLTHYLHQFRPSKEKSELLFALEGRDHDKAIALWRKLQELTQVSVTGDELFDMWWNDRPEAIL